MKVFVITILALVKLETYQLYFITLNDTRNLFTTTPLIGFYNEFSVSLIVFLYKKQQETIMVINSKYEDTLLSIDAYENFLKVAVQGKEYRFPITFYTANLIVISQTFIIHNNTYITLITVNGTEKYSRINTQPMIFDNVSAITFTNCRYLPSCFIGSIQNFTFYGKTQDVWSQWNEWSQCNASGMTSRTRICNKDQMLTCSENSTDTKSCTCSNEATWAQWNSWISSNDSYMLVKRTRECNNITHCDRCYGISSEIQENLAVWSPWSEWSQYNDTYEFMNRSRECIIFKSSTFSVEKVTFLSMEKLIATSLMLYKEHTLYFEINPTFFNKNFVNKNIIRLTDGTDMSYRCQIISVFLNQARGTLLIVISLNKTDLNITTFPIQFNNWSSIKISQNFLEEKYIYTIELNGQKIMSLTNQDAKDFSNVTVYVSDPNNDVPTGYIRNLSMTTYNPVWVQCSNWSGFNVSYGVVNKTVECIKMCSGYKVEFAFWTLWSSWSICNDTFGFMNRSRSCNMSNSINQCDGNNIDVKPCFAYWTLWTSWSTCNDRHELMNRSRSCNVSDPINQCDGSNIDVKQCFEIWAPWSECSATCGLGKRSRLSLQSFKSEVMVESCFIVNCPEDGMWGDWKNTQCSKTCGSGIIIYNRSCDKPPPSLNGRECIGISSYTEDCNTDIICSVNGNWSTWSTWSICNQPCGGGIKSRLRSCSNPKPRFDGLDCVGKADDFENCTLQNCISVKLNMGVNFIDEEYTKWKFEPTKLSVKIQDAIAKLYRSRNIEKNFSIVIHSIEKLLLENNT